MKLLLDENLPKKLKQAFGDTHQVFTVGDMKWNGKRNGELLGLMVYHGFEGLVTIDKICPISKTSINSTLLSSFWKHLIIKLKR